MVARQPWRLLQPGQGSSLADWQARHLGPPRHLALVTASESVQAAHRGRMTHHRRSRWRRLHYLQQPLSHLLLQQQQSWGQQSCHWQRWGSLGA